MQKPRELWSSKSTVFSLNTTQRKDGKILLLPVKTIKNLNVKKANLKVGDRFLGRQYRYTCI